MSMMWRTATSVTMTGRLVFKEIPHGELSSIARTLDQEKRNEQLHTSDRWQNGVPPYLHHPPKRCMHTAHTANTLIFPSYLQ